MSLCCSGLALPKAFTRRRVNSPLDAQWARYLVLCYECIIYSFSHCGQENTTVPQAYLCILILVLYAQRLPAARGLGGDHHHDIGEEVEWRLRLRYANPLGHRVPATLEICQKCVK